MNFQKNKNKKNKFYINELNNHKKGIYRIKMKNKKKNQN
jgi:hypothetical protein